MLGSECYVINAVKARKCAMLGSERYVLNADKARECKTVLIVEGSMLQNVKPFTSEKWKEFR